MERTIVEAAAKSESSSSYVCPICKKLKLKGQGQEVLHKRACPHRLDLFYFLSY